MPKIERLPDGTYETRISVFDPTTGKRHQPRVRARSKRELDNAIAKTRARILSGDVLVTDQTPLREWLDAWFASYSPPSESSIRSRRTIVNRIKKHAIADIRLGRLTNLHVQQLVNDLLADGYARNYVAQVIAVLTMLSGYAVDVVHAIPTSPMRGVRFQPPTPRTMQVWDKSQVQTFLAACDKKTYAAAWPLAVVLGLRMGEIIGLRWQDVNLKTGRITVCRTLSRNRDGHRIIKDGTKTPSGRRTLILPAQCADALTKRQRDADTRRRALGDLWSPSDAVFDDGTGEHLSSEWILTKEYNRICAGAPGLPTIRQHDLRHTAATAMLRAGIPIQTVSRILGHANPGITLNTYAWVLDAMEEEAAAKMATMYE